MDERGLLEPSIVTEANKPGPNSTCTKPQSRVHVYSDMSSSQFYFSSVKRPSQMTI